MQVPEGVDETYWLLNAGLALYGAGDFFEAHELWERAWGGEVGRRKLALQALIQTAAGLHKHREGEVRGTAKLLAKAKEKLDELLEGGASVCGLDLVAFAAEVTRGLAAADALARGEPAVLSPPPLPPAASPSGVLYLHGFASGPSSAKARQMVPALEAEGYAVAVPDLNEGDFEGLTVTRALARAKRHLWDHTLIIGSSFGGYLGALLASRDERVKALVLMAPAFDFAPRLLARHGAAALEAWRAEGAIEVAHHALGRPARIGYQLYEDALRHPDRPPLRVPAYILQGQRDDVVSPALVAEVARSAPPGLVQFDLVDDSHGLVANGPRALAAARRLMEAAGIAPASPPVDLEAARRAARALAED